MNAKVKFISYDGRYPNLCSGVLKLQVGKDVYKLDHILCSGGSVSFTKDWHEIVTSGKWIVYKESLPIELQGLIEEITECVNDNVTHGCCGGCV